ncbi:MAG TPA: AarF/UbiB family protein [Ramlibacter sp.]|uniref:ABC1 kinase family protein n=1 Tax=Ramlibacter sp. TaxID=1917967 RepID=UPI002D7F3CB3|nr:AarF/UbiB family protein [Ramlibacter sp.]HET8747176.1 AarF/UbiB family protein [Ramlibacter sp.]
MHIAGRLLRINLALWGQLLWWILVQVGVLRTHESPARRLACLLERLGTTFVKLGQGVSLHREFLPDDYVHELQRLQDHVEPFDAALARREVERSLGPIGRVFASFEAQPFAAGSIAQVHHATMPDGRAVVVKVRRPGIRRTMEQDIRILRWFLRSVLWLIPSARRLRPFELVDELARNLVREIDFRQEAINTKRFGEIFRGSPEIRVPAVIDGLCTGWVMVQEMVPGRRIDDPALAAQGPRLARALVEAYLWMFFHEGVFHADPHPGNLLVCEDGRICLHDFGLVGFLDRGTRLNLVAFMLAFAQQDADWVLDAFLDLGVLAGHIDRQDLRIGQEEIIRDYARRPLGEWSFAEVFLRVTRMGHGHSMRMPHHLLVLMRAMFLMEANVRRLDPGFNLVQGLFTRAGAVMREAEKANAVVPVDRLKFESLLLARQGPRNLGRMVHELRELAQGFEARAWRDEHARPRHDPSRRLAAAVTALGLYMASAWLLVQHPGGAEAMGLPLLPTVGFAFAGLLTWSCVRK